MKARKSLNIALLCFSMVLLTNGLAFAERQCTHQISRNPDGSTTVITDCSASYAQTSDNFWNHFLFSTLVDNLMQKVQDGMQNLRDRIADSSSAQDHSQLIADNIREKLQDASDAQQMKRQQQEIQLEELRDRQEILKQRQQDSMQNLR